VCGTASLLIVYVVLGLAEIRGASVALRRVPEQREQRPPVRHSGQYYSSTRTTKQRSDNQLPLQAAVNTPLHGCLPIVDRAFRIMCLSRTTPSYNTTRALKQFYLKPFNIIWRVMTSAHNIIALWPYNIIRHGSNHIRGLSPSNKAVRQKRFK
jgi:hypothetical protein